MLTTDQDAYDVAIIGAGISGLVCGCYLAKAGLKVLIAEQHFKPGGYCTSFRRNGFTFDAAAHCFGGYRKNGVTRKVLEDLEIDKLIKITQSDPSNTVITPCHTVSFWRDLEKTINEFQSIFPEESANIDSFFRFLVNPDIASFSRIRNFTLEDLLAQYFTNKTLKATLTAPLLGLGGLPPALMSAFIGAKLISEFLLDGGYHPTDGMQALPNALAKRFNEFGGDLRTLCPVKKIKIKDASVQGIITKNGNYIRSKYVVSNCDSRQTFLNLLENGGIDKEFLGNLQNMTPSVSNFILYLGLDSHYQGLPQAGTTFCYFSHYDLDRAYLAVERGNIHDYGGYMFYISKEMPTILAIMPAPYKNKQYWLKNKNDFAETFCNQIERNSIPHLSRHIKFQEAATPYTLYRYTSNYQGASFGWAGTPSQLAIAGFKKHSAIQHLYLTGHWTTHGLGISGVVYVGHDTAKSILKNEKIRYNTPKFIWTRKNI